MWPEQGHLFIGMGTQWPSSHLAFGGAINAKWGFQCGQQMLCAIQFKSNQVKSIDLDIESVTLIDQNFIGTKWGFSQPPQLGTQWPEQGHVLIGSAVQQWGVEPTPHPIYHWPGQGQILWDFS